MSGLFFNDVEPFVSEWLSNLWPEAQVDRRSIAHIAAADLAGFRRVHFFAGIGGWEYALQIAGWPATHPVWTGSCPCQPWSVAGKGKGEADDRHLWPEFRRLIAECRPPVVFGEQVASKAGRGWLAGVRADLEALGYAVGAADLCAACVGAPHIRQRLYWVAYTSSDEQHGAGRIGAARRAEPANGRDDGGLGYADQPGSQGRHGGELRPRSDQCAAGPHGPCGPAAWSDARWLPCSDGKARRVAPEPEFFPLAHGVPGRVGRLRAYGNAIVPQLAAAFVIAVMESVDLSTAGRGA